MTPDGTEAQMFIQIPPPGQSRLEMLQFYGCIWRTEKIEESLRPAKQEGHPGAVVYYTVNSAVLLHTGCYRPEELRWSSTNGPRVRSVQVHCDIGSRNMGNTAHDTLTMVSLQAHANNMLPMLACDARIRIPNTILMNS